ncbi:hypothetical protein P22_3897 [Propionispora sp. 2/2-37]|uniref:CtsR family transcriptional regulator n=1 Tax=Propionispora sp. 2/2-37 TaxID=1677858 RepID=UPI0006BB8C57|nr:CtsR family transcriptional regulator [Propionispora sp. 2/2-37]CUH97753.1 hypothetical protein P22_3897 [Propionispora sp. 2/2-37]
MSNLADIIEQFILRKLSDENNDIVILKRNELADEIECAPSQISYVLSTRFTTERGFIVESRRGLGGFVRIARIAVKPHSVYEDVAQKIDETTTLEEVMAVLEFWQLRDLITEREMVLLQQFVTMIYKVFASQDRVGMLRMIFLTLGKFS